MNRSIMIIFFSIILFSFFVNGTHLDPNSEGLKGMTFDESYDEIMSALFADSRVVDSIGDRMWVPWYKTSSSCEVSDLQSGNSCNAPVDSTHNCMVTDEFSQVGVLASMGKDQKKMDEFYNTVVAISSDNGAIPAWRIYRNGDTIEPCKSGINGNCDTASDGTARIIMALFIASENGYFTDAAMKAKYNDLAVRLSADFLEFEVEKTCRETQMGTVCYWLAGGSEAKRGGISSNDFTYVGYFPDAINAMLMACAQTGNNDYCDAAKDFSLNYLLAARFDGNSLSVPAFKAFKWIEGPASMIPECTSDCGGWDYVDAPRAIGICQSIEYAKHVGKELPELAGYCDVWKNDMLGDSTPIQYFADGSVRYESGYYADGLRSLMLYSVDPQKYETTLRKAINHFIPSTKTWDYTSCFGVYTQTFPIRSLGSGLGRDVACLNGNEGDSVHDDSNEVVEESPVQTVKATIGDADLTFSSNLMLVQDEVRGDCRSILLSMQPSSQVRVLSCDKGHRFEIYRQEAPAGVNFNVCLDNACVDRMRGFASWDKYEITQPSEPVQETEPVDSPSDDGANDAPAVEEPTVEEPVAEEPAPKDETPAEPVQSETGYGTLTNVEFVREVNLGSCREMWYTHNGQDIKLLECDKGSHNEVYRQIAPDGDFKICFDGSCIDRWAGFAKY